MNNSDNHKQNLNGFDTIEINLVLEEIRQLPQTILDDYLRQY